MWAVSSTRGTCGSTRCTSTTFASLGQKLALGRSMMRQQPQLVIFDEPRSALVARTEHALFERITDSARSGANAAGTITLLAAIPFTYRTYAVGG